MNRVLILAAIIIFCSTNAVRADQSCGPVPEPPNKSEVDEKIKGKLGLTADSLFKKFLNGNLEAAAEADRKIIYETADKASQEWRYNYLTHMFCARLMSDKSLTSEKFTEALIQFAKGMKEATTETQTQTTVNPPTVNNSPGSIIAPSGGDNKIYNYAPPPPQADITNISTQHTANGYEHIIAVSIKSSGPVGTVTVDPVDKSIKHIGLVINESNSVWMGIVSDGLHLEIPNKRKFMLSVLSDDQDQPKLQVGFQ